MAEKIDYSEFNSGKINLEAAAINIIFFFGLFMETVIAFVDSFEKCKTMNQQLTDSVH